MTLAAALTLVGRFRIHERRGSALQDEVAQNLRLLFPDGPSDVFAGHLRDWLDSRASAVGDASKRFGIGVPLREISLIREATTLDRGTWQRWLELRKEWRSIVQSKATGRLGTGGGSIAIEKVQPAIVGEMAGAQRGKLLIGGGGAGKTTVVVMLDRERSGADESWLVPAANLSESEVDDLAAAVRFAAALSMPGEKIWVAVDALDEVESASQRERWGAVLARLAIHDPLQIVATIRNADWERDSRLRTHLGHWAQLSLQEWPDEVVRELLASTEYGPHVTAGLLSLLRTPILLDLFWRTFVEAQPSQYGILRLPMTRHQLLSEFWSERLIRSPRNAQLTNRPACFNSVFEAAARAIGSFKEDGLDTHVLCVLASEGVLVKVGRLRPQWQFRHPLLRDFALAQWCLESESSSEVAERWKNISGAIPRQGALRGILEALTDESAIQDYPNIRFENVAEVLLFQSDESRSAFIRAIGALPARAILDPSTWSPTILPRLSPDFGSELVGAARREANLSWATRFADWSNDATWLNEAFITEANSYLRLFLTGRHQAIQRDPARTDGARLARSLRRWSESTRFRCTFERDGRYQKHFAIESIAALLPDHDTLAWLEREVPQVTWRTQAAILENLRFVAHSDPDTAANVYRSVVGLHRAEDRWALNEERWHRDISYNAFDLSLTGPNAHVSLLSSFPEAFLPVALEMAEAIHWRDEKQRENDEKNSEFLKAIRDHFPVSEEPDLDDLPDPLEDLIDDLSSWHFQSRGSPCQQAVRETVEKVAAESAEHFAVRLAPILRVCRLASMQGIALEVATKLAPTLNVQPLLAESLLDRRLFHVPGLLPALEGAIAAAWDYLSAEQREHMLSNVEATATSRHYYQGLLARRMLLASVPPEALDAEQRHEADTYREEQSRRSKREFQRAELSEESQGWQRDEHSKRVVAEWTEPIDKDKLEAVHVLYSALLDPSAQAANDKATEAQRLILQLLPSLTAHPYSLDSDGATWMWHALRVLLQTLRKPLNARIAESESLLARVAEFAVQRLEAGSKPVVLISTHDGEMNSTDNAWLGALGVANEALVHPELVSSSLLATRFGESVVGYWKSASATQQVDILHHVTFVRHWREIAAFRALAEGPLWTEPSDARPIAAALVLVPNMREPERESVLRLALHRSGLLNAEKLAEEIGGLLGEYSMVVDAHGQRVGLATLSNQCVSAPENFPLLFQPETRRAFFSKFAFGMKQQAKHYAAHLELAADFGRWNLAAWTHLHQLPPNNQRNGTDVSLFAHHWLDGRDAEQPTHSSEIRLRWWRELKPLRDAILREGNARDLFHFFFLFYNGKLLDLCGTAEMFSSIESLLNRMEPLLEATLIALEQTKVEDPDPRQWRETLDHAAHSVDWFRKDGALDRVEDAETAHRLLSRLTAAPFNNATAKDVLHRLVS